MKTYIWCVGTATATAFMLNAVFCGFNMISGEWGNAALNLLCLCACAGVAYTLIHMNAKTDNISGIAANAPRLVDNPAKTRRSWQFRRPVENDSRRLKKAG